MHTSADTRSIDAHHNQYDSSYNYDGAGHCPLLLSLPQRCIEYYIQPGTYVANPEPNMEDISAVKKSQVSKLKKKPMSDRVVDKEASKFIKKEKSKPNLEEW